MANQDAGFTEVTRVVDAVDTKVNIFTLEEKAHSMIMLCLADDIITKVAEVGNRIWYVVETREFV